MLQKVGGGNYCVLDPSATFRELITANCQLIITHNQNYFNKLNIANKNSLFGINNTLIGIYLPLIMWNQLAINYFYSEIKYLQFTYTIYLELIGN